jgi:hypothetical protein
MKKGVSTVVYIIGILLFMGRIGAGLDGHGFLGIEWLSFPTLGEKMGGMLFWLFEWWAIGITARDGYRYLRNRKLSAHAEDPK